MKKGKKSQKKYILDMFPYPSGEGLHVGHVESYTATDIISRYYRLNGYDVLHPQGFDAFGLPAENYAIKTGIHPSETTKKAIANFKKQMDMLGLSYDWNREINTSDPEFYKWTQWLFLQLYKKGLAYKKKAPVNWCENCKTVLANEQVVNGLCERCENKVIQKDLEQWFFKVTEYAEELLKDIDKMDWPEALKHAQRNWIGKSEGALLKFQIKNHKNPACFALRSNAGRQTNSNNQITNDQNYIEVFTTRPDTLFGATYLVLAPEHPFVANNESRITNWVEVKNYIDKTKTKNKLERTDLAKEKTGVELKGVKAINPGSKEEISIWIADYVLTDYGTGAIMAVPAHDERDFEFAGKFKLPITPVIQPNDIYKSYIMIGSYNEGLETELKKLNFIYKFDKNEGFFVEFNHKQLDDYVQLVKKYLNKKFWCEIIGSEYNFIYGGGEVIKVIDKESGDQALELCKKYYDKMKVHYNLYDMLWNCDFYHDLVCYKGDGKLIYSDKFNDLSSYEAKKKITKFVGGKKQEQFKIRDWLISRQRYWGAPIPMIYCDKCRMIPVPENDLPVLLPTDVDFKPTGESPLARSKKFHQVKCPKCGGSARRESDTMDTFVCSSWYFLRYVDPENTKKFASSAKLAKWLPVDLYIGGMEHAVGHLIYARFMTKALADMGYLEFREPFLKIRNQGIILAEDSRKMSKRWGNVINPDDVVRQYGADTLRMYEMFMGPLEDIKPWDSKGIIGVKRFLEKVSNLIAKYQISSTKQNSKSEILNSKQIQNSNDRNSKPDIEKLLHKTIKKVTEDIENLRFNTAISAMMILVNQFSISNAQFSIKELEKFLIILSPFAPFITEELWLKLGHKDSIFKEQWPEYDEKLVIDEEVTIAIQVNGKLRETIKVGRGISEDNLRPITYNLENVKKYIEDKEIKKFIYIKDKLVNIVV